MRGVRCGLLCWRHERGWLTKGAPAPCTPAARRLLPTAPARAPFPAPSAPRGALVRPARAPVRPRRMAWGWYDAMPWDDCCSGRSTWWARVVHPGGTAGGWAGGRTPARRSSAAPPSTHTSAYTGSSRHARSTRSAVGAASDAGWAGGAGSGSAAAAALPHSADCARSCSSCLGVRSWAPVCRGTNGSSHRHTHTSKIQRFTLVGGKESPRASESGYRNRVSHCLLGKHSLHSSKSGPLHTGSPCVHPLEIIQA